MCSAKRATSSFLRFGTSICALTNNRHTLREVNVINETLRGERLMYSSRLNSGVPLLGTPHKLNLSKFAVASASPYRANATLYQMPHNLARGAHKARNAYSTHSRAIVQASKSGTITVLLNTMIKTTRTAEAVGKCGPEKDIHETLTKCR